MGAERSHTAGLIICAVSAIMGLFFTVGVQFADGTDHGGPGLFDL